MNARADADPGLALWPLVERRAAATPDALFAVDERDRALRFAEYRDAALRAAAGLHALGIREGTAVSWQLPTRLEALVLVAALARLGARQNPILPFLRAREVGFIARQSGARFLFVPESFRGFAHGEMARVLARELPGLAAHVVESALPEGEPAALPAAPAPGGVRWIFYSSGTTADPKGARHTDASVGAAGRALAERLEAGPEDRNALVFPFTHIGGVAWLFAGLLAGFAQILVEVFDAKATVDALARHGATLAGAGTVFHQAYLAAQRERGAAPVLPAVRAFPGGGAPKPPGLHAELKRAFGGAGIVAGYGLTEHPIATMGSVRDPDEKLADSEGRATAGHRDPRRAGGRLARGPARRARSACAARTSAAATSTRGSTPRPSTTTGFLRTGDLGHLDAERLPRRHRAPEGRHHPQGREPQRQGDRGPARRASEAARRRGRRPPRRRARRARLRGRRPRRPRRPPDPRRARRLPARPRPRRPEAPRAARARSPSCRETPPARC